MASWEPHDRQKARERTAWLYLGFWVAVVVTAWATRELLG